jgi:hypothetical protein
MEFPRNKEKDITNILRIKKVTASRNHVFIYEVKWFKLKHNANLNYVKKRLPACRYFQYDKSNIINMREVSRTEICEGTITMYEKKTKNPMKVSKGKKKDFFEIIKHFPHLKPKVVAKG